MSKTLPQATDVRGGFRKGRDGNPFALESGVLGRVSESQAIGLAIQDAEGSLHLLVSSLAMAELAFRARAKMRPDLVLNTTVRSPAEQAAEDENAEDPEGWA